MSVGEASCHRSGAVTPKHRFCDVCDCVLGGCNTNQAQCVAVLPGPSLCVQSQALSQPVPPQAQSFLPIQPLDGES